MECLRKKNIQSIINEAITYTGRFQFVKSQPVTELQLYRAINGVDVDNKRFISKHDYAKNQQFVKVGSKTYRQWYNGYLRQYHEMNAGNILTHVRQCNIPSMNVSANTFGYKSIDKLKALQAHYNQQYFEPPAKTTNSFPFQSVILNDFNYAKFRGRNYLIYLNDLMKTGLLYYLLAINVNTKFIFAEPTNQVLDENEDEGVVSVSNSAKNAKICATAMLKLIANGWNPKFIESDGESSFNSDYVRRVVYERCNIQYCAV